MRLFGPQKFPHDTRKVLILLDAVATTVSFGAAVSAAVVGTAIAATPSGYNAPHVSVPHAVNAVTLHHVNFGGSQVIVGRSTSYETCELYDRSSILHVVWHNN